MAIIHVDAENFDEVVLRSQEPVLVDFWATWCGPCQMLAPVLEDLSAQDGVKIAKVDVDKEPQLAMAFDIVSIPTLLVFKGGKLVNKSVGLADISALSTTSSKFSASTWISGAAAQLSQRMCFSGSRRSFSSLLA